MMKSLRSEARPHNVVDPLLCCRLDDKAELYLKTLHMSSVLTPPIAERRTLVWSATRAWGSITSLGATHRVLSIVITLVAGTSILLNESSFKTSNSLTSLFQIDYWS